MNPPSVLRIALRNFESIRIYLCKLFCAQLVCKHHKDVDFSQGNLGILLLVSATLERMAKMQCNCESSAQSATLEGIGPFYLFTQNQNSFSPVVHQFLKHFKNSLNASLICVRQDGVLGLVD